MWIQMNDGRRPSAARTTRVAQRRMMVAMVGKCVPV